MPLDPIKLEPIKEDSIDLNPLPLQADTSRKRKSEHELSTNPRTVKARKRNEAIQNDPVVSQIEKAKAADQGAVTYTGFWKGQ